jgi:hypothetical protein
MIKDLVTGYPSRPVRIGRNHDQEYQGCKTKKKKERGYERGENMGSRVRKCLWFKVWADSNFGSLTVVHTIIGMLKTRNQTD